MFVVYKDKIVTANYRLITHVARGDTKVLINCIHFVIHTALDTMGVDILTQKHLKVTEEIVWP